MSVKRINRISRQRIVCIERDRIGDKIYSLISAIESEIRARKYKKRLFAFPRL